jgi:uncharacterized pyridoxamine 5'-phosphate oxidase family protein
MANEIYEFLKNNSPFYLATVKDKNPKIRPMGFVMEHAGKIYFAAGSHKQVYRQMVANPAIEIAVAGPDGSWLRIAGVAVFDDTAGIFDKATEHFPPLKEMYPPDGPKLALFYLKNAVAAFANPKGEITKTVNL